jgi:hypothetical protein
MRSSIILILSLFIFNNSHAGFIVCSNRIETNYCVTNDEKYLVEIEKKILRFYDNVNQKLIKVNQQNNEEITYYTLSSDNTKLLVILKSNSINLFSLTSGELIRTLDGHTDNIYSAKFSPDSKKIITSSRDNTARIWDATSGKELDVLVHNSSVYSAEFSPDGKNLVTISDSTLHIWRIDGKLLQKLSGHNEQIKSVKYSPDGNYLISCDNKKANLWSTINGALQSQITHNLRMMNPICLFSTDGKNFIICDDKFINMYSVQNIELLCQINIDPDRQDWSRHEIDFVKINSDNILTFYDLCENKYKSWDLNSKENFGFGDFCNNSKLFKIDEEKVISEFRYKDKKVNKIGFFYVFLESRPRTFLISCAADKYNPPLSNLENCKSDAEKVIQYFERAKNLEKQIADLKQIIKNSDEKIKLFYRNKLDSIQFLLSKEPILIVQKLYDYNLSKTSIISAFNEVKNQLQDDDAFVFHFTGMGGKIKNSELSTLFFSSDTSSFTANDLFQLSEIINGNNQLFLLDACQDNFVNQFKSEILNNKINSQLINRNRIVLAIKNIAVDNYKGTGGGALTYAFINNIAPFNQVFSFNNREKNEYDYNLYNGTKELREDRSLNFEVFRESDYYDVKFKEKNNKRGVILTSDENKEVEKPNTISKGQSLSVVVGINAYLNLTTLTNPLIDAEKISTILKEKYGHKVILLKDLNYSNLADSLYAIQEKYEFEEGSQFLFYFAGHGGFNKYDNSSCLLLRDSKLNSSGTFDNAMTSATLKGLINQIKATRTMVVIDACHSRKLTDDCKEAECMALDQSKKFDDKVLDSYLKSPGKVIFTSANVFQEASDGDPFQYSPFANAFISSLNERSLKKIEFDSKAVYKDMLNYQSDKNKNKNFQSEMKYCSFNESNKDDDRFIFIPK